MKKRFLIILISLFMVPSLVQAASASVSLSCPSSATSGSQIECKVNVKSDVAVNGVKANYVFSGVSYVGFTPQNGFSVNYVSETGFNVGNPNGKSGSFTIGILKVKVNNAGSIRIKGIDISDTSFNSYTSADKQASFKLKSTNNSLKALSLSNGSLSPAFSANTTNYSATINAASVTINATKGDNYQQVSGVGKKTLNYGKNTFKVVVTSESGAKKTYTINITRPDNRSTNNYLNSLSVSVGNIAFNKDTMKYSLDVEENVSSLNLNATLADNKASFVSGFGVRSVNLKYGKNDILVKVKAENEEVRTYTITVNRKDNRSSNNYLKGLATSHGKIAFSKEVLEYSITVYYDVTKIDVEALLEDEKATLKIDNPLLMVGENVVTVDVVAENESVRTYKINVKRLSEAEKMSDNNNVKSINVLGHEFDFNSDVYEYDISIEDEFALVFEIALEDEKANAVIQGNKDLKDGSVITVVSTSESGEQKEYKFNISKPQTNKNGGLLSNILFTALGFILGVGSSICVHFIRRNKHAMNNNLVYETSEVISNDNVNVDNAVHNAIIKSYDMPTNRNDDSEEIESLDE